MILHIWRHPKPRQTEGLCIGQTDVIVDKRKLKRLANRIQRYARVHHLPKVIWQSPLQRSIKVGEILKSRGFTCKVAPELAEINFGIWDGKPWSQISKQEIDDWCEDFANYAPKNAESLQQLFHRAEGWLEKVSEVQDDSAILAVGHAGWINAAKMIEAGQDVPRVAADWPRSVNYLELSTISHKKTSDIKSLVSFN